MRFALFRVTMWLPYCVGLLAALYVLTYGDDVFLDEHCKEKPDGVYDVGCRAFITCTAGKAHQVYCVGGQVFNHFTDKCGDAIHVPPPCGVNMNCTGLSNGRYPDVLRACTSYFTCNGGQFLGHNECPGGLVFNQTLGICDWAYDVFPPCGTRGV